jgi:MFS family permease
LLLGGLQPAAHRPDAHAGEAPRWARPTRVTLVLVACTLAALVLEGAAAEWSAIYMRDVFSATPFMAGAAVATGAATQAAARLVSDRFVERYKPVRVARVLLGLLGAGTLLVLLAPHVAVAYAGLALMGVGTSALFPLAMSAAAQATDRPAAVNVAALAQTSFLAFLVGPPLLGFVATQWGIRWSFGVGLPLVVLAWLAAKALAPRR